MTDRSSCVRRLSRVAAAPVFAGHSRTSSRAAVALFLAAIAVTGRSEASESMVAIGDHVELVLGPMAVLVDVQANDVNPSGEPWRTVIKDHPPVGSVVVHWDGSVTYSLDHQPLDHSRVFFSYYLEDRLARQSNVAEVCVGVCTETILVESRGDSATVELGRSVAIDVLANDSGDGIHIVNVAVNGSFSSDNGSPVKRNPDDTFLYTSTKLGTDNFGYTIEDVRGERSTATVTVNVVQPAGVEMGEVGIRHNVTHEWTTVNLQRTYARPVVIAKPAGLAHDNDLLPSEVRLTDITSNSFKMRMQDVPCFGTVGGHLAVSVSYLVVEAGSWEIAPGFRLDAGVAELDTTVTGLSGGGPTYASATTNITPRRVRFSEHFFLNGVDDFTPPAVLTHVQTTNDPSFVLTRQEAGNGQGFVLGLQKEEAKQRSGVLHGAREQVGWIAMTPGVGSWSGLKFQSARSLDCGGYCHRAFDPAAAFTSPPAFLASLASLKDVDPANLRRHDVNFSAQTFAVLVSEDISYDGGNEGFRCYDPPIREDPGHTLDDIAFLAIQPLAQVADVLWATKTLNLPPVALDQTVTVRQDETVVIGPKAVDPEGRSGCFAEQDTKGLVGTLENWPAPNIPCGVVYSPPANWPANWSGRTEFRASVHDAHGGHATGLESPSLAKITIDVLPLTASFAVSCAWRTCTFTSTSTPDATSFTWSFGDGSSASGQQVVRTYTAGGNFLARLTVTNRHGRVHSAEKFVGLPPSASFAVNSCPNRTCTFTSTSTSDATSFRWNFGDGSPTTSPSSAKTITKTFAMGGRYVVSLTAMNGVPLSALSVRSLDLPPTASFSANCVGATCQLDASSSTADATSFSWSLPGGVTLFGKQVTHTFATSGSHPVTLTATNDVGLSATRTNPVTVDLPPVAAITATCDDLDCRFDASGSSDDLGITSYTWAFGDGGTGSGVTASRSYATDAMYTVTLTVCDGKQQCSSMSTTVDVFDLTLLLLILD